MSKVFAFACVSLLLGCTPRTGALSPDGYKSARYDLKVAPVSTDNNALMSSDWKLDNFYQEDGRWLAKSGSDYRATYELDHDGDGKYEKKVRENMFELRFVHRGHDGVIFLRTVPLSTDQKDKRLDVLMERYIGRMAGSGYSVVALNDNPLVVEKRFAATIAEEGTGTLAGLTVQVATVDIQNLDQLEMDPNAKGSRLEIVLAHTKFLYHPGSTEYEEEAFPVLLVAGYWNRADEFAESQPDFRDFLNRVMVGWQKGSTLNYPEKAEPEASNERVAAGSSAEEPEAPPEPAPVDAGEPSAQPVE